MPAAEITDLALAIELLERDLNLHATGKATGCEALIEFSVGGDADEEIHGVVMLSFQQTELLHDLRVLSPGGTVACVDRSVR